jgi:hypothetical protein
LAKLANARLSEAKSFGVRIMNIPFKEHQDSVLNRHFLFAKIPGKYE